jgi:hypothetical protein
MLAERVSRSRRHGGSRTQNGAVARQAYLQHIHSKEYFWEQRRVVREKTDPVDGRTSWDLNTDGEISIRVTLLKANNVLGGGYADPARHERECEPSRL